MYFGFDEIKGYEERNERSFIKAGLVSLDEVSMDYSLPRYNMSAARRQ